MSAFAVIYESSSTPVNADVLERVMERLNHRGPDGRDVKMVGHVALGHWHFWVTPEEVGEKQPLELDGMPFKIVLDGRLDNRPELFVKLNINPADGSCLSDAALILHAYAHWGEQCFEYFIGEYALVIVDEPRGALLCARDALGDRTLFYSFKGTRLVIASEPWAVAGVDGSGVELNERAVAYYFAMKPLEDGQTLFRDVLELLPAHLMLVDSTGERHWRFWQPDLSVRLRGRSDKEYADEFRSLLEESVHCRLRATTPVGVLMSGGLDSTSVACLAARILAPQPLTTISYVFDELVDCDERVYIETVKEQCGIRSIQIPSDNAWPLKDWQQWPLNQNHPTGNPFRMVKERAYHWAHQEGFRVLLTGGFSDQMFRGGVDWLADLLSEGRLLEAWQEFSHIRYAGLRRFLEEGFLQRIARRLLNAIPGGKHLHRSPTAPVWLTPLAREYIIKSRKKPISFYERHGSMLGLEVAQSSTREIFYASHSALEIRHPFRDRRLIEFVLALPAYQLYNNGVYKYILRTAMQGILPEAIRTRNRPTVFSSLLLRGFEREKALLQACLQDPGAAWREYIRPDWCMNLASDQAGREGMVPWLCISYETWIKSYL